MDAFAPQPVVKKVDRNVVQGWGTPADHAGGLWSETRWLACDVFPTLLGPMLCEGSVGQAGFLWARFFLSF